MDEKIKKAFDEIKAEQELKAVTKRFIHEKYSKAPVKQIRIPVKAVLAAALAIVICTALFTYSVPVSAICVDTDSGSVELGVNRFDRVVEVNCLGNNETANQLRLRNMKYKDAVCLILGDDSSAMLTVSGKNSNSCKKLADEIRNCKLSDSQTVECVTGHHGFSEEAHDHGISTGKYNAYLQLKEYEPDITVEEIKALTMKEIRDRINSHCTNISSTENTVECTSSHGYSEGHKNGNHHGKQK